LYLLTVVNCFQIWTLSLVLKKARTTVSIPQVKTLNPYLASLYLTLAIISRMLSLRRY
jgi:hypothetical protein